MLTELFINLCILITFISVSHNFFMDKNISKNSSLPLKILTGICAGLLGILLMLFSIRITPSMITDFCTLPILLSALYEGFLPAIIATVIMASFRILHFGISNSSVISIIIILLMGIGFSVINLTKAGAKLKWIYSVIYLSIVNSVAAFILIKDPVFLFKVFIIYSISTLIMSYFIFKFTEYLSESFKSYKKLKNEATIDFLTGLNNVRQFNNMFNITSQQTIRNKEHLSLLFLDIDHFKKINDTFGHNSGDIILKDLADILRSTCRIYDIISRNGGEEFSILLLNCPTSRALEVAERIRETVETHKFYISDKVSIDITISIGISTYPNITNDIGNLLEDADTALYEAKRLGRNKVVVHNKRIYLANVK